MQVGPSVSYDAEKSFLSSQLRDPASCELPSYLNLFPGGDLKTRSHDETYE